jgi:uridylate kinase
MVPKFKRILLKLSGESLMGNKNFGLDSDVMTRYAQDIKKYSGAGRTGSHRDRGGNIYAE